MADEKEQQLYCIMSIAEKQRESIWEKKEVTKKHDNPLTAGVFYSIERAREYMRESISFLGVEDALNTNDYGIYTYSIDGDLSELVEIWTAQEILFYRKFIQPLARLLKNVIVKKEEIR